MNFLNRVLSPAEVKPVYPTFLSNIKSLLEFVTNESDDSQFAEPILQTLKENYLTPKNPFWKRPNSFFQCSSQNLS